MKCDLNYGCGVTLTTSYLRNSFSVPASVQVRE